MKPTLQLRVFAALAAVILINFSTSVHAGNTWDGGGSDNNWNTSANWNPDGTPGYGTANFDGSTRTNPVLNVNYNMNILTWTNATSSPWTLGSSGGAVLSLFDNGGGQAKVENNSSALVTINAPITFAANNGSPPNPFGEINAVNSDLLFGTGTLTVNGTSCNGIKLFGGSHVVTFNNTVSASSKWFGITTTGTGNTINIGGSFTSSDFYVMNAGTLNLNSGGSLTTSVRLGGDFGNTGNQNLTKSGTFNLTVAAGGQTFSGVVNSVSGNTSGALTVNSQNTSATNTLSGHIALDSALKITQSAGGALNITQAHTDGGANATGTDIKGNTLTLTPASTGTIIHGGTIYNSTGTGGVTMTGAGTNIYSAAHAYAGDTLVNAGTLQIVSGGSANNSIIRIGDTAANSPTATLSAGSGASFTSTLVVRPSASGTQGIRTIAGIDTSGTATISGGVFLDADVTVSNLTGGTLAFTGTQFDLKNQTLTVNIAGNVSMSGSTVIQNSTGSGKLIKNGSGKLTLSGKNTYSGGTTVSNGTLLVNGGSTSDNSSGTGSGAVSVNSGATLGGTGRIAGNVTYNASALAIFTQGSPLAVGGTLTLNGNVVHLNLPSNLGAGSYTLVTYTVSGSSGAFNNTPVVDTGSFASGTTASISTSGGNVTLLVQGPTSVTVSSSSNPAGYLANLTFTATVTPTNATGSVTFFNGATPFSTNNLVAGVAVSASINTLPRGTNTITAVYGGDVNYLASTNSLAQVVTNHPPVANNVGFYRGPVNTFKFKLSDLLTNASDTDGDTAALVNFSTSTNGVMLTTNGSFMVYYSTNLVNDRLTYTVSDGFGGSATGAIALTAQVFLTGQNTTMSISNGMATVNFAGIPGYSYTVQRSTNLVDWSSILTTNAPDNGLFKCVDNFNDLGTIPSSAYYRLGYNP